MLNGKKRIPPFVKGWIGGILERVEAAAGAMNSQGN